MLVVDQGRYLFHPFTPEEMAAIYSSLDVLMNASMGEGFGLTVLEAQACGVPAIVTDFTAMSEVCGAGWKVGYERHWTDQASWQARPHVEEIVESLEECYALDRAVAARALRPRPRARARLRRRPGAGGALAAGARARSRARLPGLAPPLRDRALAVAVSLAEIFGTGGSAIAPSLRPGVDDRAGAAARRSSRC